MQIGNEITSEDLKQLEEEAKQSRLEAKEIEAIKEKIDGYISNLSEKNANKLIEIFSSRSERNKFHMVDGINYIAIWVEIFKKEREDQINNTIFTERNSLQEVMFTWRRAYFLLWQIEYVNEKEIVAKTDFWRFLQEQKFSIVALQYLLLTKSGYLEKTTLWLVKEFMKIKNYEYADILLCFIENISAEKKNVNYSLNSD